MKFRSLAFVPVFAIAILGLAACGGGKSSSNQNGTASGNNMGNSMANAGANAKVPNCGAVKAVWVNLNSKVYHEPGDPYYGHTKNGEYLCPSQAKAQGFHPAGGSAMMNQSNEMSGGRHHRRRGSAPEDESTP